MGKAEGTEVSGDLSDGTRENSIRKRRNREDEAKVESKLTDRREKNSFLKDPRNAGQGISAINREL